MTDLVGGDDGGDPPYPFFPAEQFSLDVAPGFPAVHRQYRRLTDQKDMVCGAYALAYLLRAYGFTERDGVDVTVDSVAAVAGTALESHNAEWLAAVREAVADGEVSPERAADWFPHDHYDYDLAESEVGGTSTEGLVRACEAISDGELSAIPIPSTVDGEVQLTDAGFDTVLSVALDGEFDAQLICNYNLTHTLAPASLLGHKYGLPALLARWDAPDYFRTLDWDVGHFTTVAARASRRDSDVRYLLVRDSYKTFGWGGYHLQPESFIRRGLVRADDDRDGGVLLVVPTSDRDAVEQLLSAADLQTGTWDNGSPYLPQSTPFED
ncbi:DUF6885 family protein [Halorussus litoreus]|uniref:DUF6885 family protein n=1 Tax=Halorussus litoreus TaxID=1710536 RepID=UPI000E234C21|nr:hypothetical protein [Halorussus litoreus]